MVWTADCLESPRDLTALLSRRALQAAPQYPPSVMPTVRTTRKSGCTSKPLACDSAIPDRLSFRPAGFHNTTPSGWRLPRPLDPLGITPVKVAGRSGRKPKLPGHRECRRAPAATARTAMTAPPSITAAGSGHGRGSPRRRARGGLRRRPPRRRAGSRADDLFDDLGRRHALSRAWTN